MAKIKSVKFESTAEVLDHLKAGAHRDLEDLLSRNAWFPYRELPWFDRVVEFVAAYDRVRTAMMGFWSLGNDRGTAYMKKRGSSLSLGDRLAPWAEDKKTHFVVSPKWKAWNEARQSADKRGMIYDDFVAGAGLSARLRGWPRFPAANQLCSKKLLVPGTDGYSDATIPMYHAKKYDRVMRLVPLEVLYFSAAGYRGSALQKEYIKFVISEIERVHPGLPGMRNLKAERVLQDLQRAGAVPSCEDVAVMLNSKSTLTTVV